MRAWPVAAPMPKLDSFLRGMSGCFEWHSDLPVFICLTFHRWVGHVFIVYTVPNLRVVRILSYWMRYFLPLSPEMSKENGY